MNTSNIIKLNANNCQNCFKCIRECPLKAIEFKDSKTKIIEDECVLCGNCIETCPKQAKYVKQNTSKVKALLNSDKKVCISVAPSYVGWYNTNDFSKVSKALKKIGFYKAEETAIGALQVSKEYEHLLKTGQMKNIIATACSSVVMLIERHFPQLLKNLAPVSSPMMAHARLMREAYGDIKVVFVGPCLSKMHEAEDLLAGGLVNEVITFEDLDELFCENDIEINDYTSDNNTSDDEVCGLVDPITRIYPKQEGIIKTINDDAFKEYTPISIDGLDRCIDFFNSMQNDNVSGYFVEANICAGSCIGGPIMRMHKKSILNSTSKLSTKKQEIDYTPAKSATLDFPHPRVFANRAKRQENPTTEQIEAVLAQIGKTTKEQELNCGSCGYATCREKAIAVLNKKADVTMCLPFLRERAENISTIVIDNSPNGIITFDDDLLVTEINPKAVSLFGGNKSEIVGMLIPALYGEPAFDLAKETNEVIVTKSTGATEDIITELTVLYLKENKMYIAFAKDITEQEKSKEELEDIRLSTVNVAQKVIDKQMRVAQEIASLLGETTAETKVALTKLKKSIKDISQG